MVQMKSIYTALSSHRNCFICRSRNRRLHTVKRQDVTHAFVKHKIYIKSHARFCDDHIDDNGLIRKEVFPNIPTKLKAHSAETLKMFDYLSNTNYSPFEQFRQIKYLDDNECKKITGWSKIEFLSFCSEIVSLKKTKQRSKEQVIAVYRFWLITGLNQKSLALMFGLEKKQRQICSYFSQARMAIYKDFTHRFRGVNKDILFYLQYNSPMTHRIHELAEDVLVLVADGTYCNIQKSADNDFQYRTYSDQKKSSLFKPFIICCADGYLIDCYGPFDACKNDASILEYIIEQDKELKKILLPEKTLFFIDRGYLHLNFFN
jgi:hypothetical protein